MAYINRRAFLAGTAAGAFASLLHPAGAYAQNTSPILIRGSNIFDGSSAELTAGMDVLIESGLVTGIGPNLSATGAEVIDADGRTLMPGLIDMHWHALMATSTINVVLNSDPSYITLVAAETNRDALMRGFTTVRDVGGNVFPLVRATREGRIIGPRIYPSGPYVGQTGGHGDFRPPVAVPAGPGEKFDFFARIGMSLLADGVPEVMQRSREILRMGSTQIKAMAGGGVSSDYDPLDVVQFTFEEMKAIVDVAKNWNTYVTVHAIGEAAALQAIEAGVLCIEHGHLLSGDGLQMVKDKGAWLSMQAILDDEDAIPFPEGSENQRKFLQVTEGTESVYTTARELGVKMVWGTDTLFDPELAKKQGKQLAKLGRWFPNHEALAQATSKAGELCQACGPRDPYGNGTIGVVAEGGHADLLLVNGNPLEDIDLVADAETNFAMIMKGGVIHKNTLDS
ncbi:metal-dependent hydrolase family protein [Alloyangia pacifica]|uniref:metal-dependent hydrolase family protein n=1 Tax=Alloyangia pacifica TaxID=311180 RepID=UPI001CFD2CB5|nr:amidohydrolase family protein [Alloyangia pacifica]